MAQKIIRDLDYPSPELAVFRICTRVDDFMDEQTAELRASHAKLTDALTAICKHSDECEHSQHVYCIGEMQHIAGETLDAVPICFES